MDRMCYYQKCGTFVPRENGDACPQKKNSQKGTKKEVVMGKALIKIYCWFFQQYLKLFLFEDCIRDFIFCWCVVLMHLMQK
jgi:hypothetical protein